MLKDHFKKTCYNSSKNNGGIHSHHTSHNTQDWRDGEGATVLKTPSIISIVDSTPYIHAPPSSLPHPTPKRLHIQTPTARHQVHNRQRFLLSLALSLSLSEYWIFGANGLVRRRYGSGTGLPGRKSSGAPEAGINLRNLHHQCGGHLLPGDACPGFPRQTHVRQGDSHHQVLRRRRDSLHLPRPRPPWRLRRPLRLPRRLPPPLEGLPFLRPRHHDRRHPRPPRRPHRLRPCRQPQAQSLHPNWDPRRIAHSRQEIDRVPGWNGGTVGELPWQTRWRAGEAEAETGVSSIGDWNHIPLGHHRRYHGYVSKSMHHQTSRRCPRLPPDFWGFGPRRLHCSGKTLIFRSWEENSKSLSLRRLRSFLWRPLVTCLTRHFL